MKIFSILKRHFNRRNIRSILLTSVILCTLLLYSSYVTSLFPISMSGQKSNEEYISSMYDEDSGKGNDILLTLVRNTELNDMVDAIKRFEKSFNSKYHYDWWFMNDEDFSEEFKETVTPLVSGNVKFIKIPNELWSYPDSIDQEKASLSRDEYAKKKIMYGKSESYRFMCRFNSGLFYKLPELRNIEYYWRIEPAVRFDCEITYDVFQYMRKNKKLYAFNMALQEDVRTIPSLWNATVEYFNQNPQYVASDNNLAFVSDDKGATYNLCHFWSNFEIASLEFYRSAAYEKYFEFLDSQGGFFYERWGDAPVHTLAVSFILPADRIHFIANTGYMHTPNQDCPRDEKLREALHCECNPRKDFTWHKWSCVNKFFDVHQYVRPDSMESISKAYPAIYDSILALNS